MSDEPWHLNKSIPITFLFAILLQTVALIWFVATLRNDVDNNRANILRNEVKVESLSALVQDQSILLARIDENLKVIRNAIEKSQ
jgi:hypothetical protein